MNDRSITADNFAFIARLLREQCGLTLGPGKEYLVEARLAPLARKHKAPDVDQFIDRLRTSERHEFVLDVVEAMVTTETSFFRDLHPFETLQHSVLPDLIDRRRAEKKLNIWCAASSSGQEPYSIAMLLHEYFPALQHWQINLVGTDVSHEMLDRARRGCYSQFEVNRGLPTQLLLKWFRQEGTSWCVDDRVRRTVTFSRLNLAQPWPSMPLWDLIVLRNVMIYFDEETKRSILDRVTRVLAFDGYLVLGGAETTLSLSDSFYRIEALKSGFYQLKAS